MLVDQVVSLLWSDEVLRRRISINIWPLCGLPPRATQITPLLIRATLLRACLARYNAALIYRPLSCNRFVLSLESFVVKKVTTSCVALLAFVTLASAQESIWRSPGRIMNRATGAYASCRTYFDEGQVTVESVAGPFRQPSVHYFSTAFARPKSFRFELLLRHGGKSDVWDRFIAWKDGDVEKAWWSLNQHEAPLSKTLPSFVDISKGTAQTVPELLLPGVFPKRNPITYLTNLKLTGWEKIDGRSVYKLQGNHQGQPITLWIDSREFLILKIYQEEKVGSLTLATTTIYRPRINVAIPPGKLGFNPPPDSTRTSVAAGSSNTRPASRPSLHSDETANPNDSEVSLGRKQETRNDVPGDGSNQKKTFLNAGRDDVVRVNTTLVAMDVLPLDQQGNFIPGLTGNDFHITEDGLPQRLTTFTRGDDPTRPRTIVLIIDYSGSQLPFFKDSVEAAKTLVDQLNPKDRIAIVTDDVSVLVDFTQDKAKLKAKLDSLWDAVANKRRLGRSAQYSALMATLDSLAAENVHPIIIFQTDGDELATLRPAASYPPPLPVTSDSPETEFSILDVFSRTIRSRGTIYTVIPGITLMELPLHEQLVRAKLDWEIRNDAREKLRPDPLKKDRPLPEKTWPDEYWQKRAASIVWMQTALVKLSNTSGGWAEFLEKPEQAADLYSRILADINRRYIVGYQPSNKERDGKLRRVTVEVIGFPDHTILGRNSYYAPGPE